MISYLLATKHDIFDSWDTIQSILSLPEHDYEIVICCPKDKIIPPQYIYRHLNFKWVVDDVCTGSAHAFNQAYFNSYGNYIATIIDDIILPNNFLDILDFMKSDFMQKKKYKISNIMWDCGPGLYNYGHDDVPDGVNKWPINEHHPVDVNKCPYSVIPLPFFERSTIENKLDGHLFHPAFKNHFIDHWLGFYVSKNEEFEPYKWRCPSIKYTMSSNRKPTEIKDDTYDRNLLKILTQSFIKGITNYV